MLALSWLFSLQHSNLSTCNSYLHQDIQHANALRTFFLNFLVTFKVLTRACGPKITPPPRHNGERADPARARPVPFCFQGFLFE